MAKSRKWSWYILCSWKCKYSKTRNI